MLIDRGVAVALGTDVNPGAGLSPSMPFAMALACFAMNMTLEESLIAATLNAAWSINRAGDGGSLETGKLMDAVIVRGGVTELLRVGAECEVIAPAELRERMAQSAGAMARLYGK